MIHPMEATNLLKSSRKTLFVIELVIEPSIVPNDQTEVQRIFAIVKYINILLSTWQLKFLETQRFNYKLKRI